MTHRFLLDNDGSNLFYNLTDDVERDIEETARECPAEVTTYLLGTDRSRGPVRSAPARRAVPSLSRRSGAVVRGREQFAGCEPRSRGADH
jgi:hypothetical protein